MERNDIVKFLNLESQSLESDENCTEVVIVSRNHVIQLLRGVSCGSLDMEWFRSWVRTVWFGEYFDYQPDEASCISSVLDYLLICVMKNRLPKEDEINTLIDCLTENKEFETEVF